MKAKEIIAPALKLFVICLAVSFLLGATNAITKNKIEESRIKQETESKKIVFSSANEFSESKTVELDDKTVSYCTATDENGNLLGYVFTSANKGYGGEVSVMTGIDLEGKITKTVILAMNDETPGLGQNAGKDDFLDQFTGKNKKLSWVKNGGSDTEIKGVTSASFTSKAVIQSVNDALSAFEKIGGDK